MELYHFSEEPDIRRFEPRPPPARASGLPSSPAPVVDGDRVVWAIDEAHAPLYYFPRDCPRIVFWRLPESTEADWVRLAGSSDAAMVACVEWAWLERIHSAELYRYTFAGSLFRRLEGPNGSPGTWLSRVPVEPDRVEPVGDLLVALRDAGVELRFMPSLTPLRDAWSSTLHVSGIRLRDAAGWEPT